MSDQTAKDPTTASINSDQKAEENDLNEGVVFLRSQNATGSADETDDEIDDTLLIDAYDKIKMKMDQQLFNSSGVKNPKKFTSGKGRKPKKANRQQANAPGDTHAHASTSEWAVGDSCMAPYSEDGEWYEAEITGINFDNGTAIVLFTGYGNSERHELTDLKRIPEGVQQAADYDGTQNGYEQDGDHLNAQEDESSGGYYPTSPSTIPIIPPPPPPHLIPSRRATAEADALSTMLMSWYMSGYHTGYYQALQDVRNKKVE